MLKLLVFSVAIVIIQGVQWYSGSPLDEIRHGLATSYQRINITTNPGTPNQRIPPIADVCTKAGCIRGKVEKGRKNPYEAFYGIPYAEPPIGELRLENPVPHRGWLGNWDATYPRSDCLQRNIFVSAEPIVGSEDCLYLNVYRPVERKGKLPVLVYIHGGGFTSFSGNPGQFGPEYLMDNGEVILVTINYRLGIFGFLCSGDGAVKGNFGLKDQQLALKWVSSNIEVLGGDSTSITLAGQSVGAASTQYHMMNSESQILFHRAMVMSGSVLAFWSFGSDSADNFRLGAKYAGLKNWDIATSAELANQLKTLDALRLVLAHDEFLLFSMTPLIPLRPCIEGDWEGAFLKENPRVAWSEGKFPQKPIVFSMVADEGTFAASIPTNRTRLRIFSDNIYKLLPLHMDIDPRYTQDVLNFYFEGKDYIDETNVDSYYQMFGDRVFYYGMIKSVTQYLTYSDTRHGPVFIYKFGYKSNYTFIKELIGKDINLGVSHIDDLIFLFTMKDFFPVFEPNTPEGKMSDAFVRTVVNFIARGEVKAWAKFDPCTLSTSETFCDYQIFTRYDKSDPDSVLVTVSNEIDQGMVELWDEIGIK